MKREMAKRVLILMRRPGIYSGGVGSCAGSKDYDLCMETFLIDNPPAPSFQAEFRALVVSATNWFDSLSLIPLNDQETFESAVRGAAVTVYSVLVRIFDM